MDLWLNMFCDIDQITMLAAAVKVYGPDVQISAPVYIDTIAETITVFVTPYHTRSFRSSFYYKKRSFDHKDPDLSS